MHLAAPSAVFEVASRVASATGSSSVSTFDAALPSGSGDEELLVLAARALLNARSIDTPSGWVQKFAGSDSYGALHVFTRPVSGALSSVTLTFVGGTSLGAAAAWRVRGAHGDVEADEFYTQTEAPDPPEVIQSWGNSEVLAFAVGTVRRTDNTLSLPSSYTDGVTASTDDANTSTSSGRILAGERILTAASVDPGVFGMTGTVARAAGLTVVVRKA